MRWHRCCSRGRQRCSRSGSVRAAERASRRLGKHSLAWPPGTTRTGRQVGPESKEPQRVQEPEQPDKEIRGAGSTTGRKNRGPPGHGALEGSGEGVSLPGDEDLQRGGDDDDVARPKRQDRRSWALARGVGRGEAAGGGSGTARAAATDRHQANGRSKPAQRPSSAHCPAAGFDAVACRLPGAGSPRHVPRQPYQAPQRTLKHSAIGQCPAR